MSIRHESPTFPPLSQKNFFGRTGGQMDMQTDGQTTGMTNGRTDNGKAKCFPS